MHHGNEAHHRQLSAPISTSIMLVAGIIVIINAVIVQLSLSDQCATAPQKATSRMPMTSSPLIDCRMASSPAPVSKKPPDCDRL
jgi:hypothetical protein